MLFPGITNCGKIEAFYPRKIKGTIQDVYAHARNLHVALYGNIIMKIFGADAIIITLLILNFSHFNLYIFVQKNNIYQNILKKCLPNMVLLSNLTKKIY